MISIRIQPEDSMNPLISRKMKGFTFVDLMVVLMLIPLLIVGFIGCRRTWETAGRVRCAANLRTIGQALLLYAQENKGEYPRTIYNDELAEYPARGTGASAKNPFGPSGPHPNDITAAMFLLIRAQDITSETFICPDAPYEKDSFGGANNTSQDRSNFTNLRKNLGYSLANPYPDAAAAKDGYKFNSSLSAEFAVAADKNPGTSGNSNVMAITLTSKPDQMRQGNSLNHNSDGQQVLYGDGHVQFSINPLAGVDRDNIYTFQGPAGPATSAGIVGSPLNANDSVMLPTE